MNSHDQSISNKSLDRRKLFGILTTGLIGWSLLNKVSAQVGERQIQSNFNHLKPLDLEKFEIKDIKYHNPNFLRTNKELTDWTEIIQQIEKISKGEINNKKNDIKNNVFTSINAGFVFQEDALDDEFLFTNIEPLIDQAADLLDRCLKDRDKWDELSIKMFNQLQELNEYIELDAVHQEEEKNGFYEVPVQYIQNLMTAESKLEAATWDRFQKYKVIFENFYSKEKIDNTSGAYQIGPSISGQPPYFFKGQTLEYLTEITWEGFGKKLAKDHLKDAAAEIAYRNLFLEQHQLNSGAAEIGGNYGVAHYRKLAYQIQYDWESKNSVYKQNRTKISRKYEDLKAKAAANADGVLNYSKRLEPLKARFDNDFRDALARMKVIESGLSVIYGISKPLPKNENTIQYYDNCVIWVREVIQWLIKFSRKDQSTIFPISLKRILGDQRFGEMIARKKIVFDLNENDFKGMTNIRLRGLSMFVKDNMTEKERLHQLKIGYPK